MGVPAIRHAKEETRLFYFFNTNGRDCPPRRPLAAAHVLREPRYECDRHASRPDRDERSRRHVGHLAAKLIFTILRSLRLTHTEEQSGLQHVNILNQENSGLSFVDQYLIHRKAPELLENDDLFEWLKETLNHMTEDVFFGGAQAVTKAKEVYEYEED